jgi:TatD DNase family protein
VPHVAALITDVRGLPVETLAAHCTANTRRLFRLPMAA